MKWCEKEQFYIYKIFDTKTEIRQISKLDLLSSSTLVLVIKITVNFALALASKAIP